MKNKNDDSIAQCYIVYGNYIKSIIRNFFTNDDDVDDIFHEVFLKLLQSNFKGNVYSQKTKNYIVKTTKSCCISRLRKNVKECVDELNESEMEIIDINSCTEIIDVVVEGMVVNTLHDAINTLPCVEQHMLIEKYFYNKTYAEIARERNDSYYKIKKRIHTITQKVKSELLHRLSENIIMSLFS